MKKTSFAGMILLLILASNGFSENVTNQQILEKLNSIEVRITRLEEGQKSLQKQMDNLDSKFTARIDDLRSLLYIILTGMFVLIGFILWDRRTALAPAVREIETIKKRDEKIIRILEEYALKEPKLAAIMKEVAL